MAHLRRTAREDHLLNASSKWVTREQLDSRIERALKNPRELYPSSPMWTNPLLVPSQLWNFSQDRVTLPAHASSAAPDASA